MDDRPGPAREKAASEKLRRHARIMVDLGRLAGENVALDRFLDKAVIQIARAIEIDHVKILQYWEEPTWLLPQCSN